MKKRFILCLILMFALSLFGTVLTACNDTPPVPESSEYKVTFIVDNITYVETETVNGKVSKPQDPLIPEGYSFGWYNERRAITEFDFDADITADISVYGVKTPIIYNIEYQLDGGENDPENKTEYTVEEIVLLKTATKSGYEFLGWYKDGQKIEKIAKGTFGDIVLTAQWRVNEYTINYENLHGAENLNPTEYNTETETIFLLDIQADGYEFIGWFDGDEKIENIEKGTNKNLTLTAKWNTINYDIIYIYNGGEEVENPVSYNIESEDIILISSVKENYEFIGWKDDFGRTISKIETGSFGAKTLYAEFAPLEYAINYLNIEGAINSSKNPATYNVETEVEFSPAYKQNYEFLGWFTEDEKIEKIEKGSIGEISITAKWKAEEFDITYNLNGGENSLENPDKYTVEDEIELKAPTKEYYSFVGWYIGNEKVEKIEKGTFGNLSLRAEWMPLSYSLTYENLKGAKHNNPTVFTELTTSITLTNPTNIANYIFEGWYINGEKVEVIKKSAYHDDIVVVANWTPIVFNITYKLNGGTDNTENPATYTVESKIVLEAPDKDYYTFVGWYMNNKKVDVIEVGTSGNLTFIAKWTPTIYNINYELGGGTNSEDNPISYTIESDNITFANPTRDYYKFVKWNVNGTTTTGIEAGSHGDITVTAVWDPKPYNIAYENTGSASNPNKVVYNVESEFDLLDISLPERVFLGWFIKGEKVEKIEAGVYHGDIVLRAEWTYIEHNVTYIYDGEEIAVLETVLHRAQRPVNPIDPEDGYCFAWFTDEGLENQWNFNDELVVDMVLYGGVLRSYTITYVLGDGRNNANNPTSYTAKEEIKIYQLPSYTLEGYKGEFVFERWESLPAGATFDSYSRELIIPKGTTGDIVLTAVWREYTTPVQ